MNFLSREELDEQQWAELRNAPQLVSRAVSACGGSRLDSLLEGAAGRRAVENGRNNDHPLIRQLAEPAEVEAAVRAATDLTRTADGTALAAGELVALATTSSRAAADILRRAGGELDLYAYRAFVVGVARAVAEAAREGDFIGLGGQRVSDEERAVIAAISQALSG
jgi:hypothetical protein